MAGPFDLEPLWKNKNFKIEKGVLDAKTTVDGTRLGRGLMYYPSARNIIHRIVGTEAAEAVLARTRNRVTCLWSPGNHIEIVNASDKPADLFRIQLNYSRELADVFPDNALAAATAQLMHEEWPKEFQSSVKKDLEAIGTLAGPLAIGSKPSHEAIQRATRAKEDLEFKLAWFSKSSRKSGIKPYSMWKIGVFSAGPLSGISPPDGMITVTVNTQDADGKPVKGCEVLTNAWADGENPATADPFLKLSTPTTKSLSVGKYAMWAKRNGKKGETRAISIGSIDHPFIETQTVDLIAP